MTPAEEQADRLVNLAGHLRAHPHLAPVTVQRHGDLQLSERGGLGALLAWADTLIAPSVTLDLIKGDVYVHITGRLGGRDETVWSAYEGLPNNLGLTEPPGEAPSPRVAVELDVLRAVANGESQ